MRSTTHNILCNEVMGNKVSEYVAMFRTIGYIALRIYCTTHQTYAGAYYWR
jgi:hypothetical protein